jgi:2-keto-4-pentenoate hydratase/2-oxohepta-3-ene-1,7-dioic acid hydratase in catechol pathway
LLHPWVSTAFDREVELAVVLGRRGKEIERDQAYDFVFGYTCADDVAARDVQLRKHGGQWFKGASMDNSCPLGPWIVTRDEIPDPHALSITCRVNGVLKQNASTGQMVFDIPALLGELSAGMTLEPGDIILTGAPAGAGIGFDPPEFLQAGDVIEVAIEGIGTLVNPVAVAER